MHCEKKILTAEWMPKGLSESCHLYNQIKKQQFGDYGHICPIQNTVRIVKRILRITKRGIIVQIVEQRWIFLYEKTEKRERCRYERWKK